MVWILAISAATTRRATSKSSSAVTSLLLISLSGCTGRRNPESASGLFSHFKAKGVDEKIVLAREYVVEKT